MAVALRVLVQRQPGFRLGGRHLRLARPELGWLQQQADSRPQAPVKRPAMPPQQEMSMRANSPALEEARPQAREKKSKAQVKLRAPVCPANLPGQESLRGSRSAQAMCRG
jgi:hypothetical protein